MKTYKFDSSAVAEKNFDRNYTEADVKNEPMLFNCDYAHAMELGGPITRSFLTALPAHWGLADKLVFDSRVHMLMPGWYPCIPGFHHDDVPRSGKNGQPNYDNPEYRSSHYMGLINGDICPTLFALGECEMPEVTTPEPIYRRWHQEVEQLIYKEKLRPWLAPSGKLIRFDDHSFHTGQKAIKGGWRWFGRASILTKRVHHCTNEVRNQVQVYMENPMEGW